MSDTFTVESEARIVSASPAGQATVYNAGGSTVYYKKTSDVSASSNDGSLAKGESITLTAPKWFITATASSAKLFIEHTPDEQTDPATQTEINTEKTERETADGLKAAKTELTTEKERAETAEGLKASKTELSTETTNREAADKVATANAQTESYTLALGDAGKVVEMNSASSTTVTVPTNTTVAFPTGTVVGLSRIGAGAVEVKAAEGVTIRSSGSLVKLNSQYSPGSLRKRGTNEWVLTGDLA